MDCLVYDHIAGEGSGYILFDVEDQAHRFDRNQGDYWDATVCLKDKKWGFATRTKAGTYDGHVIAPGFQRVPNQARALVIMREDFAANPQNFDDLSSIWNYETKGGIGRGSDADWAQVSREVDETVAKYRNNNNALWMSLPMSLGTTQGSILRWWRGFALP